VQSLPNNKLPHFENYYYGTWRWYTARTRENIQRTADLLSSENISDRYQVYGWTENARKGRPAIIDSVTAEWLIDYCKTRADKFILTNAFNQMYKTILLNKIPIRRRVEKDWKNFYTKYPGSGGIFSFSKIEYYEDKTTAIFYYWHRRNGLNGYGAIAIMTKIDDEWAMKYKI